MTSSRLIRWGVVLAIVAGLVVFALLAQYVLGPVLGYRYHCDAPARGIADMRSIDDLRRQFNDDVGTPRLVLLLSPT